MQFVRSRNMKKGEVKRVFEGFSDLTTGSICSFLETKNIDLISGEVGTVKFTEVPEPVDAQLFRSKKCTQKVLVYEMPNFIHPFVVRI